MKTFMNFCEEQAQLTLEPLPYKPSDLEGYISSDTIDYHYNHLARGYVDRFNTGQGNKEFNRAGAYLHNLYFPQLKAPVRQNSPEGISKTIIDNKYGDFNTFKDKVKEHCMAIQGSGWCYMDTNGDIKTIANHKIVPNIALIIDWWEHAWSLDYKWDKEKYLDRTWSIINWSVVNTRIITKNRGNI